MSTWVHSLQYSRCHLLSLLVFFSSLSPFKQQFWSMICHLISLSMAAYTMYTVLYMSCRAQFHLKTTHPAASTLQHLHHLAERWWTSGHQGQGLAPDDCKLKKQSTAERHHNDIGTSWGFTQARVTCFLGRCEGAEDFEGLTCSCSPEDSSVSQLKSIHELSVVTSLAWKPG